MSQMRCVILRICTCTDHQGEGVFDNGGLDDQFMRALPLIARGSPAGPRSPKEARHSAAIRWLNVVDISGEFQDLEAGLGSPINIPGPRPILRRLPRHLTDSCQHTRYCVGLTITYRGSVDPASGHMVAPTGWLKSGRSSSC